VGPQEFYDRLQHRFVIHKRTEHFVLQEATESLRSNIDSRRWQIQTINSSMNFGQLVGTQNASAHQETLKVKRVALLLSKRSHGVHVSVARSSSVVSNRKRFANR
jgi:hypothetical protein